MDVRGALDEFQAGTRDPGGELYRLVGRYELVTAAVQDQCGHGDVAEQARQLSGLARKFVGGWIQAVGSLR